MRGNAIFKLADFVVGTALLEAARILVPKNQSTAENPSEVLVIKLSALGDTVLLSPALRALKKYRPCSRITAVCTTINEAVFRASPYVDDIIVFEPKKAFLPWYVPGLFRTKTAGKSDVEKCAAGRFGAEKPSPVKSATKKFDIAFDFDQWLRISAVLAVASGARKRAGFRTPGQFKHRAFTHVAEHRRGRHEIDCFLDVIAAAGVPPDGRETEFAVTCADAEDAARALSAAGLPGGAPYAVFHVETPAHAPQRRWPTENYARLAEAFSSASGLRVVFSGVAPGSAGQKILSRAADAAQSGSPLFFPKKPLAVYAAALSSAKILLCPNTGIMHLACAVGTPVVALHGPTDAAKWGPAGRNCAAVKSGVECSPCLYLGFEYGCGTNRCMAAITVEEVLKAALETLSRAGA